MMKMNLVKVCGLFAVNILASLLLVDPTLACYCFGRPPMTLKAAYCISDVVIIKGSFADGRFEDGDMTRAIYDFKVTQVFKAPSGIGEKISLYTQLLGSTCAYRHNGPFNENQYVVTGRVHGDHIIISACSFIQPWAKVTPKDQAGLAGEYSKGCN